MITAWLYDVEAIERARQRGRKQKRERERESRGERDIREKKLTAVGVLAGVSPVNMARETRERGFEERGFGERE